MAKKLKVASICERELLAQILRLVERQEQLSTANKEKYLKKLRDNGYLGYSREGDKYWYTQEDVDRFLHHFHFDAFAIGIDLPKQEGGGYV
ncbi:DNA-binding protein [Bacteroides ovatus]|nr:DNA-binding protein [Bacteroides ovatus]